jgi:hypothetical protein
MMHDLNERHFTLLTEFGTLKLGSPGPIGLIYGHEKSIVDWSVNFIRLKV